MTRLAKSSVDLYHRLEEETGIATGIRRNGSITVALTEERHEEILRSASLARAFDVEVHEIGAADVKCLYPHVEISDIVGAVHLPGDGQCDPANITLALAKGARSAGVQIAENTIVTAIHQKDGRVTGVDWQSGEASGTITADIVINCAGMWARDLGLMAGVGVPLHACEHFYIVIEPVEGRGPLPVLRLPDECGYSNEDDRKVNAWAC